MSRKKSKIKKISKTVSTEPGRKKSFGDMLTGGIPFVEHIISRSSPLKIWLEIALVVLLIAAGAAVRMQDLGQWRQQETMAFFDGQPLHTTFDAWFYLSLAQDLVDGTYAPVNEKRGIPDSPPRPLPPPLISVIAAAIAKITPFSVSWIGAVLPAILGPLLAVPLYLLGRYYGGPVMGFSAVLLALLYPNYIYRSNIGRFDTDCMNVFWALSACYVFLHFGINSTRKRYLYFCAGMVIYALFLWWWDQAPAAVTAVTFLPFIIALAFFYRPGKKEAAVFIGLLCVGMIGFLAVKGVDAPVKMSHALWAKMQYMAKKSGGEFPNIGISISEQNIPSFQQILSYTTINAFAFFLALAGLCLLFWKHFKHALFLASLIFLSFLSFRFANRFLIFLIPVIALGTGYMFSFLWQLRKQFSPVYALLPVLLLLLTWPLYASNMQYTQWPKETGHTAEGMDAARKKTPPDAVIWSWWDHGHALTYLARRATITDGALHGGELTVYAALPLATDSFRLSANFMHFFAVRGIKGIRQFYRAVDNDRSRGLGLIQQILGAGPQQGLHIIQKENIKPVGEWSTPETWLGFFFPKNKRPVYLFLDHLFTRIAYWWYWFGTWDIEKKEGKRAIYRPFYQIEEKNGRLVGTNGLDLDIQKGIVHLGSQAIPLSRMAVRKSKSFDTQRFEHESTYRFELLERARFGILMDDAAAESVFNKLYLRHIFPEKYFRMVSSRRPVYQLWEVRGDSLEAPPGP